MAKKTNWGEIIAGTALIISGIWFYVQLRVWKEEGHDHMLTAANIVVTILLWLVLAIAFYQNRKDARRAEILQAKIEAMEKIAPAPSSEDWDADPNLFLVADASHDFSAESNPSGPWAYGYYRGGLGGEFFRHEGRRPNYFHDVDVWESESVEHSLAVMHHCSPNYIQGTVGTYMIPPDTICMHPGENGAYVVVRWTCPKEDRYRIWYEFRGLDAQTTIADSDIDVRLNMHSLCKAGSPHILNGMGSIISDKSEVLDLKVRDTIDFVVGWGQGRFYGSDSTGLKAKIYQLGPGT
jgi:hypothetical protein